jgi:hypothetical protein
LSATSQSATAQPHTTFDPNSGWATQGSTTNVHLTATRFLGVRQTKMRLGPEAMPAWTASLGGIGYEGENVTDMPRTGMPPVSVAMTVDNTVRRRREGWIEWAATVDGQAVATAITAANEMGSPILGRGNLAAIRTGQVLDHDPLTGHVMSVDYAGPQAGRTVLTFLLQGHRADTRWTYETASGFHRFAEWL